MSVTAPLAREEHPPAGEKAIEWRLLAIWPATTLEEAVELIEWYRRRWLVEIFFRILKSGCRVETLQLGTLERLERALVIYLIIAWRILQVVTWGRNCPDLPCEVVFDSEEWAGRLDRGQALPTARNAAHAERNGAVNSQFRGFSRAQE